MISEYRNKFILKSIKQLRAIWSTAEGRKVGVNFLFLGLVQFTNFILPLLLIPFIIGKIGVSKFGIISLAQIVILFLIVIADYGFNLTATKDVSLNRDSRFELSKIVCKVILIKLSILTVFFLSLTAFSFFQPTNNFIKALFYGFAWVLGQSLIPLWFFQGIEKMKFITILNLLAKIIYALLLFLFLGTEDDYFLIHLFNGLSLSLVGVLSLIFVFSHYHLSFIAPTFSEVKSELRNGFPIFLANISITSYNNSNPLILSFFVTPLYIGYYSIAEKVIFALRQLIGIFSQSLYPYLCRLSEGSFSILRSTIIKFFIPLYFGLLIATGLIFVFSTQIVSLLGVANATESSSILRAMSFIPIIVALNIPPYLVLIIYNFNRSMMVIVVTGSILNILLNCFLSYKFSVQGTVAAVLITELYISIGMFLILQFRHAPYSLIKNTLK